MPESIVVQHTSPEVANDASSSNHHPADNNSISSGRFLLFSEHSAALVT